MDRVWSDFSGQPTGSTAEDRNIFSTENHDIESRPWEVLECFPSIMAMIFISGKTHPDTPWKDGLKKGDTGIHALINLSIQFRPSYYIDDIQILSYKVYLSIQYSKITSFLGLLMFIASKLRQILAGAALARLRTGSDLAVKFAVFWAVFMGSCGKNRRFWNLFCQQKMVVLVSKLSKIPSENGELTGPPPVSTRSRIHIQLQMLRCAFWCSPTSFYCIIL